jgi:hypothetical protein
MTAQELIALMTREQRRSIASVTVGPLFYILEDYVRKNNIDIVELCLLFVTVVGDNPEQSDTLLRFMYMDDESKLAHLRDTTNAMRENLGSEKVRIALEKTNKEFRELSEELSAAMNERGQHDA